MASNNNISANLETNNASITHKKRGSYAKVTNEKREQVIEQYLTTGDSMTQIAIDNRLAYSTARSIINTYSKENRVHSKPRGGNQVEPSISNEALELMESRLIDDPMLTLQQLHDLLLDNFDIDVSLATIHQYCYKKICFTLKCVRPLPEKRNDEDTLEARYQYIKDILEQNITYESNCIFVDEAGFNSAQIRKHGRSKKGESADVIVQQSKSVNHTIIAAISHHGMELCHVKLVTGGTTADIFIDFLKLLFNKLRNEQNPQYIIMDNAPIHRSSKVANFVEEYMKDRNVIHKIKFLPPYSPFLNPIEECFSKMKYYVKRQPLTKKRNMTQVLKEATECVTREDCQGWVNHSKQFFLRCSNMEKDL